MNRIAESAELALYRIMVNIDEILTRYSKNGATEEIEGALWKLLYGNPDIAACDWEARRNHRIE